MKEWREEEGKVVTLPNRKTQGGGMAVRSLPVLCGESSQGLGGAAQ